MIYLLNADKFSTYAVAYHDTLLPRTVNVPKAPNTGDNTKINSETTANSWMITAGIMATMLSAILLAGAVKRAKE